MVHTHVHYGSHTHTLWFTHKCTMVYTHIHYGSHTPTLWFTLMCTMVHMLWFTHTYTMVYTHAPYGSHTMVYTRPLWFTHMHYDSHTYALQVNPFITEDASWDNLPLAVLLCGLTTTFIVHFSRQCAYCEKVIAQNKMGKCQDI